MKAHKNEKILYVQKKVKYFCVVVMPNKLELAHKMYHKLKLESTTRVEVMMKWINCNTLARQK